MISHEYACIFIHIPKCAGSSIERALGHSCPDLPRGSQDHRTIREIQPLTPTPAWLKKMNTKMLLRRLYRTFEPVSNSKNKRLVTKEQFHSYHKFTVVRNPWDRLVSWYSNVIRDDAHQARYKIDGTISFREFITRFAGRGGLRTQLFWLKDIHNRIPVNYIARYETLASDWKFISKQLCLADNELPHVLQSTERNYRDYYDDYLKRFVANAYWEEIEMFGYRF